MLVLNKKECQMLSEVCLDRVQARILRRCEYVLNDHRAVSIRRIEDVGRMYSAVKEHGGISGAYEILRKKITEEYSSMLGELL